MKTSCDSHPKSQQTGQEGMALLMVLGIIAATTILATHMMAVSETLSKQLAVGAATSQLRYQCESATDTAFWMHATDCRLVTNRSLGGSAENREAFTDFEPWLMDGRAHQLEDNCNVYLNDAVKAVSVQNLKSIKNDIDEEDTARLDAVNTFLDVYQDYVDSNDLLNIYGMERDDYAQAGFPTLPRNGDMQLREELYWLPNWNEIIRGDITIIPPKGIKMKDGKGGKTNFFTASDEDIRHTLEEKALKISELDIQRIIEARERWRQDGTPLEDQLDGPLWLNLRNYFSFKESDYVEITAVATAYQGTVTAIRRVTQCADMGTKDTYADRAKETLSIWEVSTH